MDIFNLKLKKCIEKCLNTHVLWMYYIVLSVLIGISAIQYVRILCQNMILNGFHPGKALYVSIPILFTLISFIFLAIGIFITAGVINLIIIMLGGRTTFKKCLTVYMLINIFPSIHILYTVIMNYITGSYKMLSPTIRYGLYAIILILIYLAFYYIFSLTKIKALLGSLIFLSLYLSQECILILIN